MRGTGPGPIRGPRDGATGHVALIVLLLVPAATIAGCIAEPSTQLTLRRGDLARVELVAVNGTDVLYPANTSVDALAGLCPGSSVTSLSRCPASQASYVLRPERPAELPDGWSSAAPLPPSLVEALSGLGEGEHIVEQNLTVFGPYREGLVEAHPLKTTVPRTVDEATAYGRVWNTTLAEDGRHRIVPGQEANGTRLEIERWCNARFCLFDSRLTGYNATHLFVRHTPSVGDRVDVEDLDTALEVTRVTDGRFWVDGNPPHAGETYDVFARVVEIRGPPEGQRRAPSFEATTVNGTQISLDDLLDRPVVIEFFATWCPSCIENTDHLDRLDERFGDRIHIVAIGVDPWESSSALASFIEQNDVSWPVAVDQTGRISQAYHVGSLSTEVVVAPSGAIVHTETGVADHDRVAGVIADLVTTSGHDHASHDHTQAGAAP